MNNRSQITADPVMTAPVFITENLWPAYRTKYDPATGPRALRKLRGAPSDRTAGAQDVYAEHPATGQQALRKLRGATL